MDKGNLTHLTSKLATWPKLATGLVLFYCRQKDTSCSKRGPAIDIKSGILSREGHPEFHNTIVRHSAAQVLWPWGWGMFPLTCSSRLFIYIYIHDISKQKKLRVWHGVLRAVLPGNNTCKEGMGQSFCETLTKCELDKVKRKLLVADKKALR